MYLLNKLCLRGSLIQLLSSSVNLSPGMITRNLHAFESRLLPCRSPSRTKEVTRAYP